ncbi:DUF3987 domain-containing protein [Legionella pneumophila]|uniref:DUF3987 domain-containing protein n=1 Tax=Legionella pneumophila subsp. pascullei TaxID=91890 RepID=A0AAX2IUF1_LEGPN|nr:DUF3987 domain-containing protein [Legionella pneumophila]AMP90218.1 hypothetical protein AXF35_11185 [Legionella pneumophila subsp. pascullei]AMP92115.1 hypothetical protein AXF36_05615 [Legionella pneumophila subsp. pascullei]AMP95080.1 hypothetical protein AXF37_05505 [Legionella pneumophila subsp. pascullei]SQG89952.1 Uncharacterised protein [Legionella pneumophila subsp. pascullei]VEH05739.1 Uncharacterised protein [Legionella pneumophila subsp. pascullei]
MSNFITILHAIEIASSVQGVRQTDQYTNISGEDLLAKLSSVEHGEKDGSHFLRTALEYDDNGQCMPRGDGNTHSLARLLIIDCDKRIDCNGQEHEGAPDPLLIHQALKRNNIGHIIYGTHSHYAGGKGNRYRIILGTEQPYDKEQLSATLEVVMLVINKNLDNDLLALAKENNTFSQAWYYPRKPSGSVVSPLYFEYLEGDVVTVSNPQELPPTSHVVHSWKQEQADEISPIAAFNKQNKLTDLLVQYGYVRKLIIGEREKWLSPNSSSGIAGITVKADKFFSHHDDQFNNGYWHDAFDLMRGHEGLSVHDAVAKTAQSITAPDGRTIDQYNKSLFKQKDNKPAAKIEFNEYQPFNDDLLPVESVPYDVLPEVLADFIKDQSDIRGCPDDFILVSLLARMGCVFSGKIRLELTRNTGWSASPNFFWAMIGEPSSGKSNALSATSKPIQILSATARDNYRKELKTYAQHKELLESKISAAKKGMEQEAKKPKPDGSVVSRFEESFKALRTELDELEETKPTLKRYTVTKTTVEKLILILEENPDGVMLEVDELSSSFVKLSKDEHADERGLYLSGFTGDIQYPYDTVNRGTVFIPRLLLSIFGGIQPAKLKRFLNDARTGYQDDGLIQRFQGVVYPDRKATCLKDKAPSSHLVNAINQMFINLDNIQTGGVLSFDNDAQVLFDVWRTNMTERAQNMGQPFEAHLVKSYEFIASLSVYLYLVENNGQLTQGMKITAKQILSAIKLGEYFFSHARRMYGLVYKDHLPARSLSEKLAKLVLSSTNTGNFDPVIGLHHFTRSQIRSKGWTDLTTKEERREAVQVLVKYGHISKAHGNRHYLNPKLLEE